MRPHLRNKTLVKAIDMKSPDGNKKHSYKNHKGIKTN